MDTLTGTNDQTNLNAAADYEGYRAKAQKKETDDWFASQVGATPAPDAAAPAKPATAQDPDAAAPVGASGAPIPVPPGADAAEGEDASQAPENAQSVEDDEPTRTRKTLDMVGGVAKDILIGARESVPQVAGGVLDAVNEVLQLGNELGDAFNLPSTILDVDDKVPGEFFVNREQYEGAGGEVRPLSLPTTEGADSNTGQFIRSTSQFLTGFVPALRAMKGVKAVGVMKTPFAKEMAAGAIADAVAFDPYGDRLSTYLNQVPALGAIVPDYLADNDPENESSWEGRMKNAVEGMGLGAAAEGLVRAFKYYKAQKKALDAAGIEAKSINDIQVQAGRDAMKNASSADLTNPISVDDLADLGDENGDMFVVAPDGTMSAGHAFRAHRDVREIMQTVPENVRSKVEEKINNFQGTADERGEYVGATKTIALQLDYLRKSLDTTVAEAEKLDGQKLKFNTQKQGKIKSRIARLEGALVKNTSVEGLKREAAYLGAIETADARVNTDLGMDVIKDAQMKAVAEADKFRTIDGRNFYYGTEVPADLKGPAITSWKRQVKAKADAAGYDPMNDLLDQAKGLKDAPDPMAGEKIGKKPLMAALKAKGGIDPTGPLATELKALGITNRTMPGLFKNGGMKSADNMERSGHPLFETLADDGNGYVDTNDLLDKLREESFGKPTMTAEQTAKAAMAEGADESMFQFERSLDDTVPGWRDMDNNAIKQKLDDIEAERARLAAMDEIPDAGLEVGPRNLDDLNAEDAAGGANAGAKGAAKKPAKIYLNMARIKTGEDVRQVLQEMADMDADAINAKRGETVTNAETTAAAKKHYQDLNDLIGREPGPMSASQAVAARKLLTSSGEQLVELARAARAPDATPADLFKFRRGMAVHYAIQSEVIAARTETARALQSWAIPTGSDKMRAQAINDLISNAGGSGDMQKVAAAIAQLNNPTALNVAVGEAMSARLGKAFYQAWINGLLSSPKTHMVNVLSNSLASVWAIPENYLAAGMSKAFYDGEIDAGEAAARAFGLAKGVRDAVLLTARGQKAANMEGVADLFETFTKADIDHENHISAQAFGLDPSGGIGYGIDLLGRAINVPSNLLAKEDTFFKAVNYRMELHTLAYRTAAGEGLEGQEMASRMADMMLNPPADLKAEALEAAHYRTFTSPLGERGQAFTNFVNKVPGARFVVPFIRTPINIMKYTFARTPLAYASAKIRADIAAGGARAATAHARVAVGSMLMLTVADLVMDGVVTGAAPKDPAIADDWKRKHPEYSVKIGDKWYAYGRLDPIGMLMGLGADIGQITQNTDVEDGGKLVTAGLAAMSNNLASKTWLSGVYDFIAAINPNDPTSDPSKYLANMAGTVLPYSSFIRSVTTAADPVIRDTRGRPAEGAIPEALQGMPEPVQEYMAQLMNTYTKNIPGLSDNLPPVKDLWGNDISRASGFGVPFDMLSPVAVRDVKDDAVDKVIVDNRIRLSHPDRLIQGVKLTGEEYASYVELAGKPAKEKLDQLVKSPGFSKMSDGPDGMKAQAIMNVVNAYRQAAQGQMLVLYPELREQVLKRKTERATALTGAGE